MAGRNAAPAQWCELDEAKRTVRGLYFVAAIRAAVYKIKQATAFWAGCLGIVKAIFWL